MKTLVTVCFLLSTSLCFAKSFSDRALEFAAEIPDAAQVEVAENDKGRLITITHQTPGSDETFSIQAVRANNGGFDMDQSAMFARMMDGASNTLGKRPTMPLRAISYGVHQLHVAQHAGIGPGSSQTLTTVVFFQERGTWRKVITVQLLTRGIKEPSNEFILQRLRALQYKPAA